jgi:DNA-binding NarL/FixJ family response regulator
VKKYKRKKEIENQNFYFDNSVINQIINLVKKDNISAKDVTSINDSAPTSTTNKDISISALTEKEMRVCKLLTQGYSYKEIAEIIGLTTYTVNQKSKNITTLYF